MDDIVKDGERFLVEIKKELPYKVARRHLIERFEYTYLRLLLERHCGNVSAASRESNLSRKHIRTLMERYELRRPSTNRASQLLEEAVAAPVVTPK